MSAIELSEEQFEAYTTDFQKYVLDKLVECISTFTDEIDCAFDEGGQLIIMIGVPKGPEEERRLH